MNVRQYRSPFVIPSLVLTLLWPCSNRLTAQVPSLTIGQNFLASTYNVDVISLPPDANGVVGPNHFVEFINGSYAVYNKTTGAKVKRITDLHFWSSAGVTLSADDATTDPRIIYDPTVQRWFASMVDVSQSAADPTLLANDFLLAVSDTADPTLTWHGFIFQADPDNGNFADFPTLGVDSDGVYISGDLYYGQDNPLQPGLFSFPKAGLLVASPNHTPTNGTWFGSLNYATNGQVLQPVSCFDGSVTGALISVTDPGNTSDPHSNLVCFAVQNASGKGATLSASTFVPTLPWVVPDNADFGMPLLTPTQPDSTSTLMANDARLSGRANAVGGVIYTVNNTLLNNHLALRWYRVRAKDRVLLESGTLSDPSLDYFFPSIAANNSGVVIIGYNACGPGVNVSCYAIAGQTLNGVTSFGTPQLLQAGATSYHGDDEVLAGLLGTPAFSRWGDYGATSVDPADPNRFWTIQMFPSDPANDDVWSTQITELITVPQFFLSLQPVGTNMTVSWPSSAAGYQLQASPSLQSSAVWTNVTQTPSTNGSLVYLALPMSGVQEYFRLKKL